MPSAASLLVATLFTLLFSLSYVRAQFYPTQFAVCFTASSTLNSSSSVFGPQWAVSYSMIVNAVNLTSASGRAYYDISGGGYGNRTFQTATNFVANPAEFASFTLQVGTTGTVVTSNNRLYVNAPHVDSGAANIVLIFCGTLYACTMDYALAGQSAVPLLGLFSRNGAYVEKYVSGTTAATGDTPLFSQMSITNYTATGVIPSCSAPIISSVTQLPNIQYWAFCYTMNSSVNSVYGSWTVTASGIVTTAGNSSFYDSLTGGTDVNIRQSGYVVVAINGTRTWSGGVLNQYNTAPISSLNPVRAGYANYPGNPDNVLLVGAPFVSGNGWSYNTGAGAVVTGVYGGPFSTFHVSSTNKTLGEAFLPQEVVESVLAPILRGGVSAAQLTQNPPAPTGVLFYDYLYGEIPGASSFNVVPLSSSNAQSVISTCPQSTASSLPYLPLTQPPVVNASLTTPLQCAVANVTQSWEFPTPPTSPLAVDLLTMSANSIYLSPVYVNATTTVSSLSFRTIITYSGFTSTVLTGSFNYTMGLWSSQFVLLSQLPINQQWLSPAETNVTQYPLLTATISPAVTISPGTYYVSFWYVTSTTNAKIIPYAYDTSSFSAPTSVYTIIQGGSGGILYNSTGNQWITTSGQMNTGMMDIEDFGTGETYQLVFDVLVNGYSCAGNSYTQPTASYSSPPIPSSSSAISISSSMSSSLSSSQSASVSSSLSSSQQSSQPSSQSVSQSSSPAASLPSSSSPVALVNITVSSGVSSSSGLSSSSVSPPSISSGSSSSASERQTNGSAARIALSHISSGIVVIVACAIITLLFG